MSIQTVAKQFVELCNQGKNFDVMRTMYHPDIVSVEGDGAETAGQTPVIQKSERWAAVNTIHGEKVRGPYFNGPGEFAVHFTFDVTQKATASASRWKKWASTRSRGTRSRASSSSTTGIGDRDRPSF